MTESKIILFHRIAEPDSARVRTAIVDLGLKDRVDFRNSSSGSSHVLLQEKAGNDKTPALLLSDGQVLQTLDAILAFLQSLVDKTRA